MKKSNIVLILLFSSVFIFAQDITGDWYGVLDIQGQKLRIVFHIVENDGSLTATMDSPDQGAKGIPVS
ncbi:MAG: alpha/beta hydrolase, partial [Ignavibacteriae bacterium]|nr:alpha/beta hydrolase [Ignavibacteriota bacterium]